ncbi:MAG: ATP phosphoribosyltransferase regulatory subunit, partial [Actinomycetes bacterium]
LELRNLTRAMIDRLDSAGYGEVRTPSVEYERSMPGSELGPEPAYRLIDEHGDSLVLRSDMTLPIARIATTRYSGQHGPLRLCYLARSWRRVKRLSGEPREILQLGGELIGHDPIEASSEVLGLLGDILSATGLRDWRVAIGHAGVAPQMLEAARLDPERGSLGLAALDSGNISELKALLEDVEAPGVGGSLADALAKRFDLSLDGLEGLDSFASGGVPAVVELRETLAALPGDLQARTIADFSLRPKLGYYEGIIFEVYDPEVGRALGGGGRYDRLMRELGRETTAIGFALDTDLVHAAVAGEQRGEGRA